MRHYRKHILYTLFIFIISLVIYVPSLSHKFVWDDTSAVKKSYSYTGFVNLLTPNQSLRKGNYYRPVIYLSYFVDQQFWGDKSFGYHLSNLLFNSLTAVFFFWFVYFFFSNLKLKLTGNETCAIAFYSALIFSLHPMHVESVSWIAGRTDVLCTLFLFMGLVFHIRSYYNIILVIITAAAFYMSLLSKELGVVFIPLVLVMDYATENLRNRRSIIKYAIYLSLFFLYFYFRSRSFVNITHVSDKNVVVSAGSSLYTYLDMFVVLVSSYYSYIYKLLIPIEFNAFISHVTKELYYLIPSFIVVIAAGITFIYAFIKKLRILYFVIFWIFLTLGPSTLLAIIKMTPTSLAERYLYLPSAAFSIALAYAYYRYVYKKLNIRYSLIIILFITLFYSAINIQRQKVWYDDLSLWAETSVASSQSCLPHNNYGSALKRAGMKTQAIREYMVVVNQDVQCRDVERALVYNNLGSLLLETQQYEMGRSYLNKAIELSEFYPSPYMNLGIHYLISALSTKSPDEFNLAKEYLLTTIDLNPNNALSHHYLAIVYKETGDTINAKEYAQKALQLGLYGAQKKDALRILDEIEDSVIKTD